MAREVLAWKDVEIGDAGYEREEASWSCWRRCGAGIRFLIELVMAHCEGGEAGRGKKDLRKGGGCGEPRGGGSRNRSLLASCGGPRGS